MIRGYFCIFFCIQLLANESQGQKLKGQVFDVTNDSPLSGASILNLKDSTGTTTDLKGEFELEALNLPTVLHISYIGYKTLNIKVLDSKYLNITLKASEHQLNEIIVGATRFNRKIGDIPVAVQAITAGDLTRNNEYDITPVLNRLPGVFMEQGALNTNRISIRGIGSRTPFGTNRVRVYFNDIPLTSGVGESTIEDIDLGALQRVEVIRGPASGIYGAGLGGTINMISSAPDYQENVAGAHLTVGSYGLINQRLSLKSSTGNGYVQVSLNSLSTDGYRDNSEYDRQSAIISGSFFTGKSLKFSIIGTFIDLKAFIPSSLGITDFTNSPEKAAFTWGASQGFEEYTKAFTGFSLQWEINDQLTNSTSTFISFRDGYEPRPFNILDEVTIAASIRNRLRYLNETATGLWDIQAGAELFSDWYEWSTYENLYEDFPGEGSVLGTILSDNKEKRDYYNLFLQARWEYKKISIEGGVNYNQTNYSITDRFLIDNNDLSGSYTFEPVFSPRIGIVYTLNASMKLFANVSHGFSMPSLEETLTPEGIVNTAIKPETGVNYEIGIKGDLLKGRLAGEMTFYHMDVDNLLVTERVGQDQTIFLNAGGSSHNGLELLLRYYQELSIATVEPYLSATFTDYTFDQFVNDGENFSGNTISGFPSDILNFGLDIKFNNGLYLINDYRYVGEAFLNDQNDRTTESYSLLNSKIGFRKTWKRVTGDLFFGLNNILDTKYAAMVRVNATAFGSGEPRFYYPGLPRNFFSGINVKYSF